MLAKNVSQDQQTYLVSTEHLFIVLPCYFFSKTPISVSDTPINSLLEQDLKAFYTSSLSSTFDQLPGHIGSIS